MWTSSKRCCCAMTWLSDVILGLHHDTHSCLFSSIEDIFIISSIFLLNYCLPSTPACISLCLLSPNSSSNNNNRNNERNEFMKIYFYYSLHPPPPAAAVALDDIGVVERARETNQKLLWNSLRMPLRRRDELNHMHTLLPSNSQSHHFSFERSMTNDVAALIKETHKREKKVSTLDSVWDDVRTQSNAER